ncbi:MAG: glycosyltransferase family 2 protein [Microgenomates group bacterium]
MSQKLTVSVVIPSWNSEVQMKQNLPYVFAAAERVYAEIVIVDDNSKHDKSPEYLKSLGDKVRFFANKGNGGFSYTVNRGVKEAKGDIIMLLNTDVRPSPDCFEKVLKYFEDDSVYAVGFNSGEAWMGGEWQGGLFHHFKVEPTGKNKDHNNPSLWASGGQAAFSRDKWLALGGMDLLYKPFYWEDTDMGYRAWKRGWQVLWAPECKCVHDHQKSVIASNFTKEFVMATAQRNQFLFIWKNISDPSYLFNHLVRLPYYLLKYPGPVFKALLLLPAALSSRAHEKHFWKRQDRDILASWVR